MLRKTRTAVFVFFLLDGLCLVLGFFWGYYLRFFLVPSRPGYIPPVGAFTATLIFIFAVWMAILIIFRLYKEEDIALVDEVGKLVMAVSTTLILFLALLFAYRNFWFSRQVILFAWGITLTGMVLVRINYLILQRESFRRGIFCKNAVVLGQGETADHLSSQLEQNTDLGLRLAGRCTRKEELSQLLKKENIQEVFIADPSLQTRQILDLITEYSFHNVRFRIVPGVLDLLASRISLSELGDIPLLTVREVGLRGGRALLKATFDLVGGFLLFLLLSPFLLLCSILIALESRGPILITQERTGRNGEPFGMIKFRSMVSGAEKMEGELRKESKDPDTIFKLKNDPRLTRAGKWMRRWSLDELPQLFNVLQGKMSLVGPRPPLPQEVKLYTPWDQKRLRVRPGITGLWQVSGRSDLRFSEMVKLDLYYIENWSLWLDIKILLRTIPAVITGVGAY